MTSEKYIYKKNSNYQVAKQINNKSKIFGYYDSLKEAIFARDLLIKHNWDLDEISKLNNVVEYDDEFLVIFVHEERLHFLDKFESYSAAESKVDKLIESHIKNPHGGRYGLNIYKRLDYFDVRKQIDWDDHLYGIYKNLDDATFARDLLMEHDWNLENISEEGPVFYSSIHNQYLVVPVINDKLVIVARYDSENDAINNAEEDIENHGKSIYKTGEKFIVFNGKLFAIHYYRPNHKVRYFGSFPEKIDAMSVRDILIECDWDLSMVDENKIYEVNDYFWKLHIFEGLVKVIGKYESFDDAINDTNNLSKVTFESLYDPENPYSKINRYIRKVRGKYWVRKIIDGEIQYFGPYESREDAIEARDEFELNEWNINDADSLFSMNGGTDVFSEIVSNLSLWQKIIYDTIDRLGKSEFSYSELINHSFLKRYRSGSNFESKVDKHLNELIELGLVTPLGDEMYMKEF